jgi:UDP-N-acetylglucosamine transferase subunit ALG13
VIFVTVGTNEARFDRLVAAVSSLVGDERVVVQYGSSALRPAGAECVEFIPFDRLTELVREARVVVTHAGVGSILVSLTNGKRPLVVARRKRFGEAVDDHQVPLTARLAAAGLVTAVDDPARNLPGAVSNADAAATLGASPRALVGELREYLHSVA